MGMYDTIDVKYPLPKTHRPLERGDSFQTKDLGKQLAFFELSEDGHLRLEGKPFPFEGTVLFYDINDDGDHAVDFEATFSEGVCVKIMLAMEEIYDGNSFFTSEVNTIYQYPTPTKSLNDEHSSGVTA